MNTGIQRGVRALSRHIAIPFLVFLLHANPAFAQGTSHTPSRIDQNCFRLGAAAAFAEMVRLGVKELALGTPLSGEEMSALEDELRQTISEQGVQAYLESDLLVTDLFPEDVAEGKQLMVVYSGDTLEKYLALKSRKRGLVESGNYSGEARKDIAREFGRLLGYPEATIEERLR